jgi:hypothetical protein
MATGQLTLAQWIRDEGTRPEPSAQAERRQPPLAHTPEEAADAASVVGFFPGLDSQVTRSE